MIIFDPTLKMTLSLVGENSAITLLAKSCRFTVRI